MNIPCVNHLPPKSAGRRRPRRSARIIPTILVGCSALFFAACASEPLPLASTIIAPAPIANNSGAYMAPYTSDGVVADWVDKAIKAKMGSAVGGAVGAYAGQKALEQVPFVGGFLGQKAGAAIGREVAISSAGGWDFIKKSSDLSFGTPDALCVWLYAKYSTNEHYKDVLDATMAIYPEVQERYSDAIASAART